MRRIITLIAFTTILGGCAHKDLKAPCANVAPLASASVPCDQRQPVNAAIVPSTFAR